MWHEGYQQWYRQRYRHGNWEYKWEGAGDSNQHASGTGTTADQVALDVNNLSLQDDLYTKDQTDTYHHQGSVMSSGKDLVHDYLPAQTQPDGVAYVSEPPSSSSKGKGKGKARADEPSQDYQTQAHHSEPPQPLEPTYAAPPDFVPDPADNFASSAYVDPTASGYAVGETEEMAFERARQASADLYYRDSQTGESSHSVAPNYSWNDTGGAYADGGCTYRSYGEPT
jgi:hypothetical protein